MTQSTFYGETLFDESKTEEIKNYKFKGVDSSILYKYIVSPFAQLLVDKVISENIAFAHQSELGTLIR